MCSGSIREPDTRAVETKAVDANVVDARAAISQKMDTRAVVYCTYILIQSSIKR